MKRKIKSTPEQIVQDRSTHASCATRNRCSRLTLPYARHDAHDPFGTIYGKQLVDAATSGEMPPTKLLMVIVETIREDASIHEATGNFLKADIERRWS